MATIKYFSGTTEVSYDRPMQNAAFAAAFPGVRGVRYDGFQKLVAKIDGQFAPITRAITYKSNPSLHKCDARCMNATGHNCECSCGGKNHGAGNH